MFSITRVWSVVVAASVLGCGSRNDLSTAADACDKIWFVGDKSGAVSVVLDETYAYWTTYAGRLQRGTLATGDVVDLAQLTSKYPVMVPVDDWLLITDGPRILRVSKQDGSYTVLAVNENRRVWEIAADAQDMYFIDDEAAINQLGGEMRLIHWSWQDGFKTLKDVVFFGHIALDANNLYFAVQTWNYGPNTNDVVKMERASDAVTILMDDKVEQPIGLAVRGSRVVYGNMEHNIPEQVFEPWLYVFSAGSSSRIPFGDVWNSHNYSPHHLAVDDTHAYVIGNSYDDARIVKVPFSGGSAEVVSTVPAVEFGAPAVSDTHVAIPLGRLGFPAKTNPDFANVIVLCK
jgi:hypothetical protein